MKLLWSCKGVRNEEKRGRKMARSDDALRTARAAESTRRLGSSWLCLSVCQPNHNQPAPTTRNHVSPECGYTRSGPRGAAESALPGQNSPVAQGNAARSFPFTVLDVAGSLVSFFCRAGRSDRACVDDSSLG